MSVVCADSAGDHDEVLVIRRHVVLAERSAAQNEPVNRRRRPATANVGDCVTDATIRLSPER